MTSDIRSGLLAAITAYAPGIPVLVNIIQRGSSHTNSSSRDEQIPIIIVDHISAGTMSSMDAWFTSPDNQVIRSSTSMLQSIRTSTP